MERNLIWVLRIFSVDRDMKLSENPQRALPITAKRKNVGVSDDAFDKHESPL